LQELVTILLSLVRHCIQVVRFSIGLYVITELRD